jgi:hypothetical protein
MHLGLRISLSILLAAPVLAPAQTLYKWVDPNGRVTYSDTPPVGEVRTKETLTIPAAAPSPAVRQLGAQEAQFKKRQEEAQKAQAAATKKEELERMKADNCTRARGELRALRDNAPLSRLSENGERVPLDAGAREAETTRLENYITENCQING